MTTQGLSPTIAPHDLAHPTSASRPSARRRRLARAVALLAALYAGAVVLATLALHLLADRWWVATIMSYGPRWPLLAPAPVIALLAVVVGRRRWALATVAAGLLALGAYMDLSVSLPQAHAAAGPDRGLTVATFNVRQARLDGAFVEQVVAEVDADVSLLVECRTAARDRGLVLDRYDRYVAVSHGLCLFSRYPIVRTSVRDQTDAWEKGGSAAIMRTTVDVLGRHVDFLSVHLATVRPGLEAVMDERLDGVDDLERNTELRRWESQLARQWADASANPLVVLGDLNLPVESAIYRRHWSAFRNAHDECGTGFGATKHTRWFGARMDHILMSAAFRCESVTLGDARGSDHSPVIAQLRFEGRP